jgi:hypothetical protein
MQKSGKRDYEQVINEQSYRYFILDKIDIDTELKEGLLLLIEKIRKQQLKQRV